METRSASRLLAQLDWIEAPALADVASPAAHRALTQDGLLVDNIQAATGIFPDVVVTREEHAGPNLERDIELRIPGRTLIEAHSLLPLATLESLPWLGQLGSRALGCALREHGFTARSAYAFARCPFPLMPGARRAQAPSWARRFRFLLPYDDVTVVEVFSPELIQDLAAQRPKNKRTATG